MEHTRKSYFSESEYDHVKGFTLLDVNEEKETYHIAEKWFKHDDDGEWIDYHISEAALLQRVENGFCELAGTLTDEQYAAVCENVGWEYHEGTTPKQEAEA